MITLFDRIKILIHKFMSHRFGAITMSVVIDIAMLGALIIGSVIFVGAALIGAIIQWCSAVRELFYAVLDIWNDSCDVSRITQHHKAALEKEEKYVVLRS